MSGQISWARRSSCRWVSRSRWLCHALSIYGTDIDQDEDRLFDSGTLHQTQYGHLYSNTVTKILARSTTQSRMTESAEYFLAGFFGLRWSENATLERIIEGEGFNNSLAGYD